MRFDRRFLPLLSSLAVCFSLNACSSTDAALSASDASSDEGLTFSGTVVHPVQASGLCLDVANGSTANGTAVQIATCNGGSAQNWSYANGQLSVFGSKCLDVTSGVNANGTKLQIWDCSSGNTNQQWTMQGNTLVWTSGGKCVDIPGDNAVDGQHLQIYTCNQTNAQQWLVPGAVSTSTGVFHPQSNTAMCLDVANANQSNGTAVQIATCNGNAAQSWTYTGSAMTVFGSKCLDVTNGSTSNGTLLQIWDCGTGNTNQAWQLVGNTLVWVNHNKCLDVPNNNTSNGVRMQIYDCTASDAAQMWVAPGSSTTTTTTTTTSSSTSPSGANSGKYKNLVWSDEFNGSTLDTTKWTYEVNCDGGGNNEDECYTSSSANLHSDGAGHMALEVIKSSTTLSNGKTYTSARINSMNKGDFVYGRWEARIQVPSGQGFWPAFWTMPTDSAYGSWPTSGELDIMEILGGSPGALYGTAHYGVSSPYTQSQGIEQGGNYSTGFHVYALERDATQIRWYVDNTLYYTMNSTDTSFWPAGYNPGDGTPWPFTKRFYTILNLAMGGNWPGAPDASIQSGSMLVDYVRIFQ